MSEAAENSKRELEIDQTAEAAEEQPAAKRAKTEADAAAADAEAAGAAEGDADMAEDAEGAAAEGEEAADGEAAAEDGDAAEEQAPAEPVKLGYRTFKSAEEASDYIAGILKRAKPGENLNEYELLLLLDLLQKGHPRASEKLSKGIKGIQVAEMRVGSSSSSCFHIQALDGTLEDFSYRKCLLALFPDTYVMKESSHQQRQSRPRGGGRGGSGSGGRGGGRGGGGRGGGRGRGRGGGRGRGRGRGRH